MRSPVSGCPGQRPCEKRISGLRRGDLRQPGFPAPRTRHDTAVSCRDGERAHLASSAGAISRLKSGRPGLSSRWMRSSGSGTAPLDVGFYGMQRHNRVATAFLVASALVAAVAVASFLVTHIY
jgi:hypothetical protein